MSEVIYDGGTVIIAVAAVLMWLFAADYARSPWWTNPGGRLVMTALVSLATVSTLVAVRNLFGAWPGMEAVRLLVYAGATVAVVWAWTVHRRAQRGKHRAKP